MNFDELKNAWQSQGPQARLCIDADVLAREVQRNERRFAASIFWRDVREVGVSLIMVPVWFYLGARHDLPWTWYLGVPALLWIAGFMLVDRMTHQRVTDQDAPLSQNVALGLAQVEHQIWLLRNVLWWYLLPPGLAVLAFFTQVLWLSHHGGWIVVLVGIGLFAFEVVLSGGIYWFNQFAVREELEPRRQELLRLKSSLGEVGEGPGMNSALSKKTMKLSGILWIVTLFCIVMGVSVFAHRAGAAKAAPAQSPNPSTSGSAQLTNLLVSAIQQHKLPAMAASLVTSQGLELSAVAGTRKRGADVPATMQDKWHLGSDGKAMTATLIARLVETNLLRWDSTIAELFPDLAPGMDPAARAITVTQLLTHRAGLKPNPDLRKYGGWNGTAERLRLVNGELSKPLKHAPGTRYEYSNLGYALAGAVAERITGKTWEEAIREEVFRPLKMDSAGFGGTGTPGQLDQPWGHSADGEPVPGNGPEMDNPPVLGPAGRVHCTMEDWAKFIADQLRGARGEAALLKPETYKKLHTSQGKGDYGFGWLVVDRSWGGGKVLNHAGDNTMNFANVWVAPLRNFAVLTCANQSGDEAFEATDEVIGKIIELHLSNTRSGIAIK